MRTEIPAYGLYGERGAGHFPDPLHVETIAARSSVHAWRIRPHRHTDLVQFFLLSAGGGRAIIGEATVPIETPMVLVLPPIVVHGFDFVPGTEGFVASVPTDGLARALAGEERLLGALDRPGILPNASTVARPIAGQLEEALDEFSARAPGRSAALGARAGLIAIAYARAVIESGEGPRLADTAQTRLLRRFLDDVEADFRSPVGLEERARRLGVSPSHLSRVCRRLVGRSAQAVLHERILLEARRNLVYTSMTVAEVAYALGFGDPAYFSRFFAARMGTSPARYRSAVFEAGEARVKTPDDP